VHVQIGVKEISEAGENLALIQRRVYQARLGARFAWRAGPTRMHYERAMTAVAYVAQTSSAKR